MAVAFVPGLNVTLIGCGGGVNEAVTACADVMVTTQLPVPAQAPPHAANALGLTGVAVSVTAVPLAQLAAQVPLGTPAVVTQLINPRLSVTAPLPVPMSVTVSGNVVAGVAVSSVEPAALAPPEESVSFAEKMSPPGPP